MRHPRFCSTQSTLGGPLQRRGAPSTLMPILHLPVRLILVGPIAFHLFVAVGLCLERLSGSRTAENKSKPFLSYWPESAGWARQAISDLN
jgi:hypothetical protein